MESQKEIGPTNKDLSPYAGRWVAIIGRKVISQGGTPRQAFKCGKKFPYQRNTEYYLCTNKKTAKVFSSN